MYDFILQMSFMTGLAAAVYLVSRAVPRITDEEAKTGFFERWLSSARLEKVDDFLNLIFEKILRKIRIALMRVDNAVSRCLDKVKKSPAAESPNGNHVFQPPSSGGNSAENGNGAGERKNG